MLTSTVRVALSAAGLAIALLTAYRGRFVAATRMAALALLPVGLNLTGLLTLARKIGRATGSRAADLVFKPFPCGWASRCLPGPPCSAPRPASPVAGAGAWAGASPRPGVP